MPTAKIIKQLIDATGYSVSRLERELGYGNTGLAKAIGKDSRLKEDKLRRLYEIFPELNRKWLETGEGDMFLKQASTANSNDEQVVYERVFAVHTKDTSHDQQATQPNNNDSVTIRKDRYDAMLEKLVQAAVDTAAAAKDSAAAARHSSIAADSSAAATNKALGMLENNRPTVSPTVYSVLTEPATQAVIQELIWGVLLEAGIQPPNQKIAAAHIASRENDQQQNTNIHHGKGK